MNDESGTTSATIAAEKQTEVAVLAGGCFWGVEEILRDVPGVIDTDRSPQGAEAGTGLNKTRERRTGIKLLVTKKARSKGLTL